MQLSSLQVFPIRFGQRIRPQNTAVVYSFKTNFFKHTPGRNIIHKYRGISIHI